MTVWFHASVLRPMMRPPMPSAPELSLRDQPLGALDFLTVFLGLGDEFAQLGIL